MYYVIVAECGGYLAYDRWTGIDYAIDNAAQRFRAGWNTQVRDSDNNIIADCIHRSNPARVPDDLDCSTW